MPTRGADGLRRMFSSLEVRNFRVYFLTQAASVTGSWMQIVAQSWLVLQLTDSAVAVGMISALQYGPLLVLGPWGGSLADRVDKRRLLLVAQSAMAVLALGLWIVTSTGQVSTLVVYAYSLLFGLTVAVDNPTRRAFVMEMVGPDRLTNAIALNSTIMTASRVIGPAIGGVVIQSLGTSACFLINAVTYLAMIVGLAMMRPYELQPAITVDRRAGSVAEGFRYVARTRSMRWPIGLVAVASALLLNYPVLLPMIADRVLHGDAATFGIMFATVSIGSVVGALVVASKKQATPEIVVHSAIALSLTACCFALVPYLPQAAPVLLLVGLFESLFVSSTNAYIQTASAGQMRGRVLGMFSAVFIGGQAVGGPLTGVVAELVGPRLTVAIGGVSLLIAAVLLAPRGVLHVPRVRHEQALSHSARDGVGGSGWERSLQSGDEEVGI